MRATPSRPTGRLAILVLGVLVAAALATATLAGATSSEVATAAGDEAEYAETGLAVTETPTENGVVITTAEPEQLGTDLGDISPTWHHLSATAGDDRAHDVVATAQRTVYVTGGAQNPTYDLMVAKYVDGTQRWVRTYGGPAGRSDRGQAIAARGGRIYTAGYRQTKWGDLDLLVIRWDSNGNRIWTRAYDSGDRMNEYTDDVAVDGDGNVVVLGHSYRPATDLDWVIVSYRPDGTRRWVRRYDGPAHQDDLPAKMLIDAKGRIYVAGYSRSAARGLDALLVKYSQAGAKLWSRRYNGSADSADAARSLCARPGGGVYVCGYTTSAATGWDGLLLAYTSAGSLVLTKAEIWMANNSTQAFNDVAVMRGGVIACGGYGYYASGSGQDRFYILYDSGGALRGFGWWVTEWNEAITSVASDGQGGLYLTGTLGTATGTRVLTQRLCVGGTEWSCLWPSSTTLDFVPEAIAVNGVNAYVVGGAGGERFVVGHVY